ncbi:hypothetical protein BFG52_10640 [Acinetobacter larvae]|uniref:Uncharacterized protein n=2 Tax=Acinetobacter larvae TaxID=1789224 RepID=A0A1B2M4A0_9GAMM|nr:hypothetical protein BFG52_10640 [Acinetobacter larvae]
MQQLSKYQDDDFYDVNQDIATSMLKAIAQDPDSFHYDFPDLQKAGFLQIHYSPDKKLKFYTFDVGHGGTMAESDNYVQYYVTKNDAANNSTNKILKFDQFTAGSHIYEVKQVNIQKQPVYLVASYYKGSNCNGIHALRAVQLGPQQLLKSYVFQAKNKSNHEITLEYDCSKIDSFEHEADYFRLNATTVDVLLLDQNNIPQNKYLRYRLDKKAFVYTGIVK